MTFTRLIVVATFLFVKFMVIDMTIVGVNEEGKRVGESHPGAKLTDRDIDLIRQLHDEGLGYTEIAVKFEISKGSVRDYVTCRRRAQYPTRFKRIG